MTQYIIGITIIYDSNFSCSSLNVTEIRRPTVGLLYEHQFSKLLCKVFIYFICSVRPFFNKGYCKYSQTGRIT